MLGTALVGCGAGLLAVALSGGSAGAAKRQTLTFTTVETSFHAIPISGQTSSSPVPGDYVVVTDKYLQHGRVVGGDKVHCVLITTKASLCYAGVTLSQGELTLQGIGPPGAQGSFNLAITGGTASFATARGQVHFRSGAHNTGTESFSIES